MASLSKQPAAGNANANLIFDFKAYQKLRLRLRFHGCGLFAQTPQYLPRFKLLVTWTHDVRANLSEVQNFACKWVETSFILVFSGKPCGVRWSKWERSGWNAKVDSGTLVGSIAANPGDP